MSSLSLRPTDAILKELLCEGHAKVGPVNADLLATICHHVDTIFEATPLLPHQITTRGYVSPLVMHPLKQLHASVLGKSPQLDAAFKEMFNDELLKVVQSIGGPNAKLSTFHVRQADANSLQNSLHQDGLGMFSLALLLNDVDSTMPTTVFMPKTHKYWANIEDTFEPIDMKYYQRYLKPCVGQKGELFVFFNKTWHGAQRAQPSSSVKADTKAILMAFDAEGFKHSLKNLPEHTEYGVSFKDAIGPTLYGKLNDEDFLSKTSNEDKFALITQSIPSNPVLAINSWPALSITQHLHCFATLCLKLTMKLLIKSKKAARKLGLGALRRSFTFHK